MDATHALTRSRRALSMVLGPISSASTRSGEVPSTPSAMGDLSSALTHCEHGEWVEAFDDLALLADAGNADAARIALMLHAQGTRLLGHHFAVGTLRAERWLDAASGMAAPALGKTGTEP